MSERTGEPGSENLSAQVEEAERRLKETAEVAKAAEQRATAEIRALEADLEKARFGKEQAIAAAEGRLGEIEAQAEVAEKRIEAAERRAAEAAETVADGEARAREAAAAWLRGQIESVRREAGRR